MKTELDIDEENLDQELENVLNHPAPAYGEKEYWNSRYEKQTETFEWFQSWSHFQPHVSKYLQNTQGSAMNLGCGNSAMSSELVTSGFSKVVNIDISDKVIKQMKDKYSSESRLEWEVMDCTKMTFTNSSFDYVFDKGTLDTLMCCDNSAKIVSATIKEISRILKPGGFFILVSYGNPNTRRKYFENAGLSIVDTITVPKPGIESSHFVYVIKRDE